MSTSARPTPKGAAGAGIAGQRPTVKVPPTQHRRPRTVALIVGLLLFLGVSAVGGGVGLASGAAAPPDDWLPRIPLITSWLVPGLVLAAGFGFGSLVAAYGMLARPSWWWLGFVERLTGYQWAWAVTTLIGAGQLVWIALELVYLPQTSLLQAVYATTGVLLVALPMLPAVRRYLALSPVGRRWLRGPREVKLLTENRDAQARVPKGDEPEG